LIKLPILGVPGWIHRPGVEHAMARNCRVIFWAIAGLVVLLPSCAVFRPSVELPHRIENRQQLAALATWRMDGRVGVRSADESWQAGLIWNHDRDVDRLYLSGPFGQGAMNIKVSEGYIRVTSADGTIEESEDPEQLLESILGIAVPVPALRYWLLGLSYPLAAADSEYDGLGRLIRLDQLGWETRYQDYQAVQHWSVPRKLSVINDTAKVKLVIDEWRFPDPGQGPN
jgi:outer membrane lipoprotein LolB